MRNREEWLSVRTGIRKNLGNMLIWFLMGWVAVELLTSWTSIPEASIKAFAGGLLTCFVGLTVLGGWRQEQLKQQKLAARDQFIEDQKADQEQQARVDKEIVTQLQNKHNLSGEEQDKRLKALEAALKHLRKK